MALVLITHDLALVASCKRYHYCDVCRQVVESGLATEIFKASPSLYASFIKALPEFASDKARLESLPGVVPGRYDRPIKAYLILVAPMPGYLFSDRPELKEIVKHQ